MDLRRGGKAAIDRIMKAYGFTTKQALCDKLGISSSTLANRYTRDSLPTDFIVQCAIETGASVEWLAFGTQNNQQVSPLSQAITEQHHQGAADSIHSIAQTSPNEIKINPNQGGKAAIERLVEAYGFTTRQALADHLGVSKSTLANRYLRDTFPADWIIQCALETGISLRWLTTGTGSKSENKKADILEIPQKKLIEGTLHDCGYAIFDKFLLQQDLKNPFVIIQKNVTYVVETEFSEVQDGKWMVSIDSNTSIKDIVRIPGSKIRIIDSNTTYDCKINDIIFLAKIIAINLIL